MGGPRICHWYQEEEEEEELNIISITNMLKIQFTKCFLIGYLGRHQKTNNCLYEMSPFIELNDELRRNVCSIHIYRGVM